MKNNSNTLSQRDKATKYLEDAAKILNEKAGAKDGLYTNSRYVKMAARRAHFATLLIVDEYLRNRLGENYNKPADLDGYIHHLENSNRKLMPLFISIRDRIYILGYLHGSKSINNMRLGLKYVHQMLNWIWSIFP